MPVRDLSLHVLDLAQNSVQANASLVEIAIAVDPQADRWTLTLTDDGDGMSAEMLQRVRSPFATTRSVRKVGLGIPLMEERAQLTGGAMTIESAPGKGTRLSVWLGLSHIDRPPLGDLAGTMLALVLATPERPDFTLSLHKPGAEYVFDTRVLRQALGEVPLTVPEVIEWMRQSLAEGVAPFLP